MTAAGKKTVAVAMSGGVDSSVAAALLAREGSAAMGLTMKLWDCAEFAGLTAESGACCSPADAADAAGAAKRVGLDHCLVDMGDDFRRLVLEPFCREYAAGRTPSPCVGCNKLIKFGALAERARQIDCDTIATGHYARIERDESGTFHLLRGASRDRDQSYFLAALGQAELARARMPVGELGKEEVRAIAAELGLEVAEKPASQETCFAPDGDYSRVLARHAPEALEPGPLVDSSGRRLGEHRGIGRYTIGQRRGLGVAVGEAIYVISIDAAGRTVTVGPDEELYASGLEAGEVNWVTGQAPKEPLRCTVRVRHGGGETLSTIKGLPDGHVEVRFDEPVRAVAPGQWAAFYDGEEVLGGAVIDRALG